MTLTLTLREQPAVPLETEGLTPDRLGRKFKRVFSNVRDAVAESIQED